MFIIDAKGTSTDNFTSLKYTVDKTTLATTDLGSLNSTLIRDPGETRLVTDPITDAELKSKVIVNINVQQRFMILPKRNRTPLEKAARLHNNFRM